MNDAQGMAAVLKGAGFNVTLGLELSQAEPPPLSGDSSLLVEIVHMTQSR